MKKKKEKKGLGNIFSNVFSINKVFEIITSSKSFKMAFLAVAVGSLALNTMTTITEVHANTLEPQVKNFEQNIRNLVQGYWLTIDRYSPPPLARHLYVINHVLSAGDIYTRKVNNDGAIVGASVRVNRGSRVRVFTRPTTVFTIEALTNVTGIHIIYVYLDVGRI